MSEENEPDWLAELAKELFERAEQFVRDAGPGKTSGVGPVPPFQQRLVHAATAAMSELVAARQPVNHPMLFPTTVLGTASLSGVGTITATGGVVLPSMSFSGQATVENPPSGQAERSIGQILALVLVAIVASGLLGVQGPDRAAVDHYLTVMSVALPVAVLIWSKQNKPK